ncbi:uncharacterized protein PHACADRAFT_184930 [Phanerochaete carnosa HHB-10118-sp]|uniref:F-box domain-containing protein n=1 Tax=Phanerochaete carnosa (strain HHB-10118-sp) TaxID=650164 RepID=K5VR16_PHACS|nr:uncharacterized protein PHACADRAFT_184930 [Phanerochaete carnosa HHB-10118-sp]EKM53898.1 hypothetical protein PHACADRAFT_184930 [Phanerochaete carnosa HHB-10118-sp]
MPSVTLPQELIDHILDLLAQTYSDTLHYSLESRTRTLSACTQVSRAWLPRSSRHLFYRIWLRNSSYSSFIGDVQESPRLSQHVARVVVRVGPTGMTKRLQETLSALPNLRELEYWDLQWRAPNQSDIPLLLGFPQRIRDRLARLTVSFAAALDDTARYLWELNPEVPLLDQYRERESSCVVECPTLESGPVGIILQSMFASDAQAANAVLYHVGCDVQHIELRSLTTMTTDVNEMIALHHCKKLKSISMQVDDPQIFVWLSDSVVRNLPTHLRRVNVVFNQPRALGVVEENAAWEAFIKGLQRCDALEAVEFFEVCRDVGEKEKDEMLRRRETALLRNFPSQLATIVTCWP